MSSQISFFVIKMSRVRRRVIISAFSIVRERINFLFLNHDWIDSKFSDSRRSSRDWQRFPSHSCLKSTNLTTQVDPSFLWRNIPFKIQSGYFPYRKINFRVGNRLTGSVIVGLFQTSSLSAISRVWYYFPCLILFLCIYNFNGFRLITVLYIKQSASRVIFAPAGFLALWGQKPEEAP